MSGIRVQVVLNGKNYRQCVFWTMPREGQSFRTFDNKEYTIRKVTWVECSSHEAVPGVPRDDRLGAEVVIA
ncbi:MAG: hypothetical protein M3422_05425 [Actinomycetota bacterium]|nr:hypothetical protein [Actinomycetota bacterium]